MKKLFALTLLLALCSLTGPAKPAHASTCTDICLGDYSSCKVDCRFNPYPGCLSDCSSDYQACLSHC
jgi:hypothetical protein